VARPLVPSIPERLDAHSDVTGKGVVVGFVDSGFYPHSDLMRPKRRIKGYADATRDVPKGNEFFTAQTFSWHGTMTACAACGNGYASGGVYRGIASGAEVVLIKARDDSGKIRGKNVAHAIRFPLRYPQLGIRILNVSLGVDDEDPESADVDRAVEEVVGEGITVFAAAGNVAGAHPETPGSSPWAITVGGQDDRATASSKMGGVWPASSYGSRHGVQKPELLAPAIWLPAPMLPSTITAREAGPLFQLLSILEEMSAEHGFSEVHSLSTPEERESVAALRGVLEARVQRQKYISPEYQHVDGTSFASPIAASVAAQLLELDPTLTPSGVREALITTAEPLADVSREVQGAGLLRPRAAVDWVRERLAERERESTATATIPPAKGGGSGV
jgi:serine protease AprX